MTSLLLQNLRRHHHDEFCYISPRSVCCTLVAVSKNQKCCVEIIDWLKYYAMALSERRIMKNQITHSSYIQSCMQTDKDEYSEPAGYF